MSPPVVSFPASKKNYTSPFSIRKTDGRRNCGGEACRGVVVVVFSAPTPFLISTCLPCIAVWIIDCTLCSVQVFIHRVCLRVAAPEASTAKYPFKPHSMCNSTLDMYIQGLQAAKRGKKQFQCQKHHTHMYYTRKGMYTERQRRLTPAASV